MYKVCTFNYGQKLLIEDNFKMFCFFKNVCLFFALIGLTACFTPSKPTIHFASENTIALKCHLFIQLPIELPIELSVDVLRTQKCMLSYKYALLQVQTLSF